MAQLKDKQLYKVAYAPETKTAVDEQLRKARLGDPSGIERDIKLNCPNPA